MKDFTIKILPEQSNLSYAMEFIEDTLVECQISGKDKSKSVLLAEEYLVELFKVTKENRDVIIRVRRFLGKTTITLMAESNAKIQEESLDTFWDFDHYEFAPNAEAAIRSMIINAYGDVLSHNYRHGINKIVITAGISKKLEYLKWAETKNGFIVEDNYDSELTVSAKPEDALFSLSNGEKVIYLNTFSKTVAPSLRMGYMVLPKDVIDGFDEKLGFYSCTVPIFEQLVVAELLKSGNYERHINKIRREKRKMMQPVQ